MDKPVMHRPDGHGDVSPYLIVADAQAVLDFLDAVFAAPALRIERAPDGRIEHAEARVGDGVVMMGEAPGGGGAHVHVYVADPEAAFARALAAGGTQVQPLERHGDGDLRGGVADGHGTTWWIARTDDPVAAGEAAP